MQSLVVSIHTAISFRYSLVRGSEHWAYWLAVAACRVWAVVRLAESACVS